MSREQQLPASAASAKPASRDEALRSRTEDQNASTATDTGASMSHRTAMRHAAPNAAVSLQGDPATTRVDMVSRLGNQAMASMMASRDEADASDVAADANALAQEKIAQSGGQALPSELASRMTAALGVDVSHTTIHTDAAAAEAAENLNAHAFAMGSDIYFAQGMYQPGTPAGDELIAHELTHVVQDMQGRLPGATGPGLSVSSPTDTHEQEAYDIGARAAQALHGGGQPMGLLGNGKQGVSGGSGGTGASRMVSRDAAGDTQATDTPTEGNTSTGAEASATTYELPDIEGLPDTVEVTNGEVIDGTWKNVDLTKGKTVNAGAKIPVAIGPAAPFFGVGASLAASVEPALSMDFSPIHADELTATFDPDADALRLSAKLNSNLKIKGSIAVEIKGKLALGKGLVEAEAGLGAELTVAPPPLAVEGELNASLWKDNKLDFDGALTHEATSLDVTGEIYAFARVNILSRFKELRRLKNGEAPEPKPFEKEWPIADKTWSVGSPDITMGIDDEDAKTWVPKLGEMNFKVNDQPTWPSDDSTDTQAFADAQEEAKAEPDIKEGISYDGDPDAEIARLKDPPEPTEAEHGIAMDMARQGIDHPNPIADAIFTTRHPELDPIAARSAGDREYFDIKTRIAEPALRAWDEEQKQPAKPSSDEPSQEVNEGLGDDDLSATKEPVPTSTPDTLESDYETGESQYDSVEAANQPYDDESVFEDDTGAEEDSSTGDGEAKTDVGENNSAKEDASTEDVDATNEVPAIHQHYYYTNDMKVLVTMKDNGTGGKLQDGTGNSFPLQHSIDIENGTTPKSAGFSIRQGGGDAFIEAESNPLKYLEDAHAGQFSTIPSLEAHVTAGGTPDSWDELYQSPHDKDGKLTEIPTGNTVQRIWWDKIPDKAKGFKLAEGWRLKHHGELLSNQPNGVACCRSSKAMARATGAIPGGGGAEDNIQIAKNDDTIANDDDEAQAISRTHAWMRDNYYTLDKPPKDATVFTDEAYQELYPSLPQKIPDTNFSDEDNARGKRIWKYVEAALKNPNKVYDTHIDRSDEDRVDEIAAVTEEAIKYIISELKCGHGVVVGVSYNSKQINSGNADHYVTVLGMSGGKFEFNDPAGGVKGHFIKDSDGILIRDPDDGPRAPKYEVTQVRKNRNSGEGATEEGTTETASRDATSNAAVSASAADSAQGLMRQSSGQALGGETAARMSQVLGADVSGAAVHTDAAAAQAASQLNAKAFAVGSDVYFGAGNFQPGSRAGDELLAHELAHTVQASEGRLPGAAAAGLNVSSPSQAHEQEAYDIGARAAAALHDGSGATNLMNTDTAVSAAGAGSTASRMISRDAEGASDTESESAPSVELDPVAALSSGKSIPIGSEIAIEIPVAGYDDEKIELTLEYEGELKATAPWVVMGAVKVAAKLGGASFKVAFDDKGFDLAEFGINAGLLQIRQAIKDGVPKLSVGFGKSEFAGGMLHFTADPKNPRFQLDLYLDIFKVLFGGNFGELDQEFRNWADLAEEDESNFEAMQRMREASVELKALYSQSMQCGTDADIHLESQKMELEASLLIGGDNALGGGVSASIETNYAGGDDGNEFTTTKGEAGAFLLIKIGDFTYKKGISKEHESVGTYLETHEAGEDLAAACLKAAYMAALQQRSSYTGQGNNAQTAAVRIVERELARLYPQACAELEAKHKITIGTKRADFGVYYVAGGALKGDTTTNYELTDNWSRIGHQVIREHEASRIVHEDIVFDGYAPISGPYAVTFGEQTYTITFSSDDSGLVGTWPNGILFATQDVNVLQIDWYEGDTEGSCQLQIQDQGARLAGARTTDTQEAPWIMTRGGGGGGGGGSGETASRDATSNAAVSASAADSAQGLMRQSSGQALGGETAARMSQALGADVSGAALHTDAAAAQAASQLNAKAFAVGSDVYFGAGNFQPGSRAGDELLAHELAHTVQASEGRLPGAAAAGLNVSSPSQAHEQEAYDVGARAAAALHDGSGATNLMSTDTAVSAAGAGSTASRMVSRDAEEDANAPVDDGVLSPTSDFYAPNGHAATLYFDVDDATLGPTALDVLKRFTTAVALSDTDGAIEITVEGHTDYTAGGDYNQALSERRALAVSDYLRIECLDLGITVFTIGMGEEGAAICDTGACATDRRVEIHVSPALIPGSSPTEPFIHPDEEALWAEFEETFKRHKSNESFIAYYEREYLHSSRPDAGQIVVDTFVGWLSSRGKPGGTGDIEAYNDARADEYNFERAMESRARRLEENQVFEARMESLRKEIGPERTEILWQRDIVPTLSND